MNKYKYKVALVIEVDAFDESDAWDAVQETFGVGDSMGITVLECEYKEIRARKR